MSCMFRLAENMSKLIFPQKTKWAFLADDDIKTSLLSDQVKKKIKFNGDSFYGISEEL